ncbi:hypothetical protein NKH77_00980 [Streptomyces sp. M19]
MTAVVPPGPGAAGPGYGVVRAAGLPPGPLRPGRRLVPAGAGVRRW